MHVTINFSIIAGACVIIVIGLWGDGLGIKAWVKIAGQAGAATFLVADGIGTQCTGLFFNTLNNWLSGQQQPGNWLAGMAGSHILLVPGWITYVTSSIVVIFVV